MKKLNLGCGNRINLDWTNVDIVPRTDSVIAHDLRKPLPFSDESFDVVYHSHVLEHLKPEEANAFIRECFRVLGPGGLIRVVVPDLERIVAEYLTNLRRCREGDATAGADYDWIMLEMYDQTTREESGGNMLEFFRNRRLQNREYVLQRVGDEARRWIDVAPPVATGEPNNRTRTGDSIQRLRQLASKAIGLANPRELREFVLRRMMTDDESRALEIGQFRIAGEIHQHMYDSFSLSRLLETGGFSNVHVATASESAIPNWKHEGLDTDSSGNPLKPDSLFVEGRRL